MDSSSPLTRPLEPEGLPRALADWLAEPDPAHPLPLPGDAWMRRLLVVLADHVDRQEWVARVLREHLGADLEQLGTMGGFGHPEDLPQRGPVPGLPGWTYFFHGIGCCLTHDDGTAIDVDFDREGYEFIDPHFFSRYLASAASPTPLEQQLRRPEPWHEVWMVDLPELHALGLIDKTFRFQVTELGHRWAAALAPAMQQMTGEGERAARIALALGDFSRASALGPLSPRWLVAAQPQAQARLDRLEQRLVQEHDRASLLALADLDRARVLPHLQRVARHEPLGGLTSAVLDVIEAWGVEEHEDLLLTVATRSLAEKQMPYARFRALKVMMRRDGEETLSTKRREQFLALVAGEGGSSEGELAWLHALLDPEAGCARLGQVLHSEIPLVRQEAAVGLVLLGTEQAAAALRSAGTPEAAVALALLRGLDPEPGPEPVGQEVEVLGRVRKVYTFDELLDHSMPDELRLQLEQAREELGPLLARWWAS